MKKISILLIALMVISVGFLNGCTEQEYEKDSDGDGYNDDIDAFPYDPTEYKDSDNDGMGDNSDVYPTNPYEQYDSDNDGIGDNADAFPYDSTQWIDNDGDGYGDNKNGVNPDAFPNDSTEWNDSDNDGIGDNADILDTGNAGIKVAITKYVGDGYNDEFPEEGELDPYFQLFISIYNKGTNNWSIIEDKTSGTFWDDVTIYDPLYLVSDVYDDVESIKVTLRVDDKNLYTGSSGGIIDINGESITDKLVYTYFYPHQESYTEYTADGRLDLLDEMDGYIEWYIELVEV